MAEAGRWFPRGFWQGRSSRPPLRLELPIHMSTPMWPCCTPSRDPFCTAANGALAQAPLLIWGYCVLSTDAARATEDSWPVQRTTRISDVAIRNPSHHSRGHRQLETRCTLVL